MRSARAIQLTENNMNLSATLILQLILFKTNLLCSTGLAKYTVEMLEFDALEAEEELLIDFRNVRLVGRHRALNGTVYILEDMDGENFQFSLDFRYDRNKNGRWQPALSHVPIMNICRAMELFIGTFAKSTFRMDENTNLPFDGKSCPLPKGTYYIKNMLLNTDTWPDLFNFGGLELNLRFYKHGKSIGGASCKTIMEERVR